MFILTDDFIAFTFGYFLKNKDEVNNVSQNFKALVENQTSETIKILRTDNGREFVIRDLDDFLKMNDIRHYTNAPNTSEQNGVAERANRTVVEKARCMLQDSKLSKKFWEYAIQTAIYLKNRSPSKAIPGMTPVEAWTGKKPDLTHLRVFGCRAFAHQPKQERKKLDSKSR